MSSSHPIKPSRRAVIQGAAAVALSPAVARAQSKSTESGPRAGDRVFLTNEDSNTLSVIDPVTDELLPTVNLTSFDEDSRPPFRFVTGNVTPTHGEMVQKPLYHGAISIHGCVPSPDSSMFATAGRGTSNLYLVDTTKLKVIGNRPNPQAGTTTSPDILTSGILVGREPHEPTFTRNGKEVWVALRGESKIAVIDVQRAVAESAGELARGAAIRRFMPVLPGPAMVWFSAGGETAFLISQKLPRIEVFNVKYDAQGFSTTERKAMIDTSAQDRFGFAPFVKISPDGQEFWVSQKLADCLSVYEARGEHRLLDHVPLGDKARPNHVEFVKNARGSVAYATFARVDDDGPEGRTSSRIAIIDRSVPVGKRRVIGHFFSHGREAHGIWTDPSKTKLYVAHELDELPGSPHAGQTVCSAFDIGDPMQPRFIKQIPLGTLDLPSGKLRNKKSINLVYVRPGARSETA
ncbi:MAG: YncE family protein [Bosea sp.]|uniref:YncE family protein n=1 Tax=Bosea sp. (in: a-proteobacteria) TaxID=1871050 RepID=UPI001AC9FD5C|nr:YncE family protein [Bosea sp. (in: a-proteobacteria)]MBN9454344.1 YncE family protein [Bosea sp. (in: a-proteobacteria)]